MFKTLFRYSRVSARHANGPLAEERRTFLSYLQNQGVPSSTLLRYASQLLLIARRLIKKGPAQVARAEIICCAERWAQRQRQRGRARTRKWSAERFAQVACAWYCFLGWLKDDSPPKPSYACQLESWACFLSAEGLSKSTSDAYRWWIRGFLQWLKEEGLRLRRLTPAIVDRFMEHLSSKGLSRVSLLTAAKVLRRFLRYAYGQAWCQRDLAQAILCPRLFRQESLPVGPTWPNVLRIIAACEGTARLQLRNRAILLLLAIYALRSGELRSLCLEDIDWNRRILRVRRSKTARVQEYPLTTVMGSPSVLSESSPA